MMNLDGRVVVPLTTHNVLSLVCFADAMDRAVTHKQQKANPHSLEIRRLASRIVEFGRGEIGTFTTHDVALLTHCGDGQLRKAQTMLANPAVTADERANARLRLDLGNDLLEIRDRVGQFVP